MTSPPIIGRERMLLDKLTKYLLDAARRRYDWTPLRPTSRGNYFDVQISAPPDAPQTTHWVARVTVELIEIV